VGLKKEPLGAVTVGGRVISNEGETIGVIGKGGAVLTGNDSGTFVIGGYH